MKSFAEYIVEMPILVGDISTIIVDKSENEFLVDYMRRGRKFTSHQGVEFYFRKTSEQLNVVAGIKSDLIAFYVEYSTAPRGRYRFGPLQSYRTYTNEYIELVDKTVDREVILALPSKFLLKEKHALVSDRSQSRGGMAMWTRMMKRFSSEGHQVGWVDEDRQTWDIKPESVDFDAWLKSNNRWGLDARHGSYKYFILPK